MDIQIIDRMPTPEEYLQFRRDVGWREHTPEIARRGLEGTLFGVCAYVNGVLAGMARVIGDGTMVFYIQDVIVRPAFQRQGIGARMMDRVMEYIRSHADQNSVVGLMAAKGVEPFYTAYGFNVRPNEALGAGMTIFWQKDGSSQRQK